MDKIASCNQLSPSQRRSPQTVYEEMSAVHGKECPNDERENSNVIAQVCRITLKKFVHQKPENLLGDKIDELVLEDRLLILVS